MPPRKSNGKRKPNQRSKSKSPVPPAQRGGKNTGKKTASTSREQSPQTAASLPSAGLLLTCDPPTKQYIKRLDDLKTNDKKFIIEDLDETHLLVKEKAYDEILRKVEDWMNEVSYQLKMCQMQRFYWLLLNCISLFLSCHRMSGQILKQKVILTYRRESKEKIMTKDLNP